MNHQTKLPLITVLALLLLFPAAQAVETQLTAPEVSNSDAYPAAVSVRYEPSPAQPGQYIDVWLTIENRGKQVAENIEVKALPEYPFTLDQLSKETVNVGSLQPFSRALAKFKVRVDATAVAGSNYLDFEITSDSATQKTPARVTIDIRPLDYLLSFDTISVEPSPVTPGSEVTIKATLANKGSTVARSLKAQLILPSSNMFVPVKRSNEQTISILEGGSTSEFIYSLVVEPEAASGPYLLPLQLTFYDVEGERFNQTQNIGIVVGSKPKLDVIIESTTITEEQDVGEITVKFVNRGLENIKFLNVKLQAPEGLELISSDSLYIGKIDSDDFETVTVKARKTGSDDKILLPVLIDYVDANNRQYNEGLSIPVKIFSEKDLTNSSGNTWIIVVVILVAAIGGFILYKRKGRKH